MKKFLVVLLLLVIAIAAVGFFLPGEYSVERSIVINAKPSAVHKLVGDLKRWDEWTPWKEADPSIQVTFGQETSGVGASQTWTSKEGSGSLRFTAADEDKGIEYDMTFAQWTSQGAIRYERVGDSTKVTWTMNGDLETPVLGGYMALLMPSMISGDFDKGLQKLKRQAEK
jgi:hypothetical protein